jgi:hypothetical protein
MMKRFSFGHLAIVVVVVLAFGLAVSSTPAWACGCSCTSDADCHGIFLCNPASGHCERPTDECSCDADCDDGQFCNGAERCDLFAGCVAGCAVDCSAADDFCGVGVCDEEARGCVVVPQNDGLDCGDVEPDACVLSSVCSGGECVATPLCDEECERCDPEGCVSLCGNPWGTDDDTVNSTDALFTLRASVGLEECNLCVCDVDGNGTLSCTDTLMMLRYIVGLGDVFVCSPSAGPGETTTTTTSLPMF